MAFERFKRKGGRPRMASLDQGLAQLHERVSVIMGSKNEVERVQRYYAEYDAEQQAVSA